MKKNVVGIVLGFLIGSSLLVWAVGATPFDSVILRNTTLSLTSLGHVLIDNQKELRLGEPDGAGSEYVSHKAPATLSASTNYTWPTDDGDASEVLTSNGSGVLSWEAPSGGDNISVNGSAAADANFLDGDIIWTLDTGPTPDTITGTVAANSVALGTDTTGNYAASSSEGGPATSVAANSVALTTDTTGDYVSGVTTDQGLLKTGTEGATLGLIDCAATEILKRNAGDTAWECAADAGSAGGDSITVNGAAVTDPDFIDGDIEFDVTSDDITATIGANGVDDILDIATALKTGTDAELVTGTPGSTDDCAKWNADGDLVSAGAACGSGGGGKPWEKFTANQAFLPVASFATQDTRNTHPVLDFDAAADECAYFGGFLASTYAGGGLNVVLAWMATSATTGATGWLVSIEAHPDDALDLDSDSFVADNSSSATTASATGEVQYTTIAFTDGADMDSLAAGESYRLRVCRDGDGSVVTDDMTGDAELYKVIVSEP